MDDPDTKMKKVIDKRLLPAVFSDMAKRLNRSYHDDYQNKMKEIIDSISVSGVKILDILECYKSAAVFDFDDED